MTTVLPFLEVRPLGSLVRAADRFMEPLMRLAMNCNGTPDESPIVTHRWNNHHLKEQDVGHLFRHLMVTVEGLAEAAKRSGFGRHLPGRGWQKYTVVVPEGPLRRYHVGWVWEGGAGVSRLSMYGPVRVLRGPQLVSFFAIDAKTLRQTSLTKLGEGQLGEGDLFRGFPIL